jgi:DNA helicase II / ATP-dependent DNA helicase PcrA
MKLNQAQKLAIHTIEGPVMVIAGPGTGKTEIIAQRIANILTKTDTSPDSILALTFTESGAKAMRERLIQTIGQTAYYVNIYTFHSFCSGVIQEFPDKFIISPELAPLSALERVEIFHQILDDHQFNHLKPPNSPYYYASSLIRAIQDLKREAVNPKEFKNILSKEENQLQSIKDTLSKSKYQDQLKNLNKNKELLTVYRHYQKILKTRGRYDFEDMINLVVEAFRSDDNLLKTYQERLHYFLVDEFQDTNSAQNRVVNLLASYWGDQANVFVVGDSNQSIYRFQGASMENTLSFQKSYPQATIITLEKNYRSTQTILDSSYALIQKNNFKLKSKLVSQSKSTDYPLNIIHLPSEALETYYLANQVKALIKKGIDPQEIAVIYRHNADAFPLADMFSKLALPIDIEGGGDILTDPTINQLLNLLKVIHSTKDNLEDLDLFTLFHYPFFNFDPLDILKISRLATQKQTSIINLIQSSHFKSMDLKNHDVFTQFLKDLTYWQQLDARHSFQEFFEILIKKSGFLDHLLISPDAVEKLNRLNSLFSEIKNLNSVNHQLNLSSFLSALELMEINHLKINEKDLDIKSNAVTLTTAHQAKGKEWAHVFIYRCVDKKWGNNQIRQLIKLPQGILTNTDFSKKEKNEDERRLFYVALTRAKTNLYLSFADLYSASGYLRQAVPSMFIQQLPQKKQKKVTSSSTPSQVKKILTHILSPAPKTKISSLENKYLTHLIKDFKLSPTALNTYLTCPYKFKLNNLIKVPRAKQDYLAYGTAIHKALEKFYQKFKLSLKLPTKSYLLKAFESALNSQVLTKKEHQSRLKQGQETLSTYFDHYQNDFREPLFIEKSFNSMISKPMLDDIPLSGKIDRIDWSDKSHHTVKVIDYKTGSPKTRNQILGQTKDSEGDLIRQLTFYKLLTQLDHNFKPSVVEAELDFIEPNKYSGKLRRESFKISNDMLNKLKQEIKTSMKSIRDLNFTRTKKLSHCEYCEFKPHCHPNGQ